MGWSKRRPAHLATQDSHFVAEDDDLDSQIAGVAALQAQQLKHPDEHEVEEGQSHRYRPR